jgi:tellurite resistance protein
MPQPPATPPPRLSLTEDLAHEFLGALLTVCRADGDVNAYETAALEHAAAQLGPGVRFDNELLLTGDVSPEAFASAVRNYARHAFRGLAISQPADVARAFARIAERVAAADGDVNFAEARTIRAFVDALDD